jgi:hypothetical protein
MLNQRVIVPWRCMWLAWAMLMLPIWLTAQTPWIAAKSSGGTVADFQASFVHFNDGARWDGNFGLPDGYKKTSFKVDSVRVVNDSVAVVYSTMVFDTMMVFGPTDRPAVFRDTISHTLKRKRSERLPAIKEAVKQAFPHRQVPEALPVLDYPARGKRRDAESTPIGLGGYQQQDPPSHTPGLWVSWMVILGCSIIAYRLLASRPSVVRSTSYGNA